MDRTERFYKIDRLLQERVVVPVDVFLGELEVSRATFKRDLEYLRDRLVVTDSIDLISAKNMSYPGFGSMLRKFMHC